MKRVKHYNRPMSKFDMAYEIDRIHYSFMGLSMDSMTYDELRNKLYITLLRYASHRLVEFTNL